MASEKKEAEILLGENTEVLFRTKLFGIIPMHWSLGKMTLGRMLKLTKVYLKMEINEEQLKDEDLAKQLDAQYNAVLKNAKHCAKAVAIAVDSKIPVFILKRHFLWNLNSKQLQEFTMKTLKESNFVNFTGSISLMGMTRMTKPKKIDE